MNDQQDRFRKTRVNLNSIRTDPIVWALVVTRTNQSEQHSVSSILNQTCFGLQFNNLLPYGFVCAILFPSKCICRQKKYFRKKSKKLCLMGQIVIESHSFLEY